MLDSWFDSTPLRRGKAKCDENPPGREMGWNLLPLFANHFTGGEKCQSEVSVFTVNVKKPTTSSGLKLKVRWRERESALCDGAADWKLIMVCGVRIMISANAERRGKCSEASSLIN